MKTIDITKPVMQRIVGYEKKRTARWLKLFFGAAAILASVVVVSTGLIVKQMIDFRTFDMLSLFEEDREIIAQFWQDTLVTVWAELPQQIVITSLVALVIFFGLILFTGTKRKIIKRKLSEVAKYQQKK